MKRITVFVGMILLLEASLCLAQEEELTITTYYPSPHGVYRELRLYPTLTTDVSCDATNEGAMFYDDGTDFGSPGPGVYYCDGADWQTLGGGYWAFDDTNKYLYTGDVDIVGEDWYVGIGTKTPNNTLQVKDLINFDNENYSTSLGYLAGRVNTSFGNSFIGYRAGNANTTGIRNTFVGTDAGYSNLAGNCNTFIGYRAGSDNTASWNTFVGYWSGRLNTTGGSNTFIGNYVGHYNTSGSSNTFIGNFAGEGNTTGDLNIALGSGALISNTTGRENTAIGNSALGTNATDSGNTAIGTSALQSATDSGNTAIGWAALERHTIGRYNTALGDRAGYFHQTGSGNVFIGSQAAGSMAGLYTAANYNVIIGEAAGFNITNGSSRNIFIGYRAGYNETGSDKLYIDNSSTSTPLIYGDFATDILTINGNLGIGTTNPGAYKLYVSGDVWVDGDIGASGGCCIPDYVFDPQYKLITLKELREFIADNKHLPGMPSAKEVRDKGVKLFEQNRLILEKLEEAYLYIMELQERIENLEAAVDNTLGEVS